jgi:hypothetical protein
VNALELLADVVRDLPEDDERLQTLVTLAVRHGQFTPGPAADYAITRFTGASLTGPVESDFSPKATPRPIRADPRRRQPAEGPGM